MPHTSHVQERSPTSIALLFLQSCLNAHCVLAYIAACWPLDRRILHELYFACAATSRVPPAFDREWFHHLANGSHLHAFSQGRAFLCFVVQAHSIAGRPAHWDFKLRAQKKTKTKKSTDGTASALRKRLAFLALPWSVMRESADSWAREGKWKYFGGSAHCIERCFRSRGSLLLRLDEGQLTSASWAHLTVESYGRIVKDSSCVHWKSEEHNSGRWLAFQNRRRDDISNEKHTHRSRFSPAMPRTSFPDNLWKSPLFCLVADCGSDVSGFKPVIFNHNLEL